MSQLPIGFHAAGLPRHDRPRPSRHGLAIFYSEAPAAAAACFTTNIVKCVHIPIDQEHLKHGKARVIMVNSGCANCCTGARGVREARKTIDWASKALGVPGKEILVASTGVIGDFMPMDLLAEEIPMLSKKLLGEGGARYDAFHKAAEAIMTTDTTVKIAHASVRIRGKEVRLWGCCKGAGMIHPQMTLSGVRRRRSCQTAFGQTTFPARHDARFYSDRLESRRGGTALMPRAGDGRKFQPGDGRRRYVHQRQRFSPGQRDVRRGD